MCSHDPMSKVRLSVRDSAFGHSPVCMGPTPPVEDGTSPIIWDRESPASPSTVYTDQAIPAAPDGSTVYLVEPYIHLQAVYTHVLERGARFKAIWTHDRQILEGFSNAKHIPPGASWLEIKDRHVWPKTKGISTIASPKDELPGQKMRHEAMRAAMPS